MSKSPTSPTKFLKDLVTSSAKKAQRKEKEEKRKAEEEERIKAEDEEQKRKEERKKKEDEDRNAALKRRQSQHDAFPVLGQSSTKAEGTKETKGQDDNGSESSENWDWMKGRYVKHNVPEPGTSSQVPGPPVEGKLKEADGSSPKSESFKRKGSDVFPDQLFKQAGVERPLADKESPTEMKQQGATPFPLSPKKGESSKGGQ